MKTLLKASVTLVGCIAGSLVATHVYLATFPYPTTVEVRERAYWMAIAYNGVGSAAVSLPLQLLVSRLGSRKDKAIAREYLEAQQRQRLQEGSLEELVTLQALLDNLKETKDD